MTDADLARVAAELDAVRARYLARASARIASVLEDCRAHAEVALTQRLKGTPDGRPTARLGARSRSTQAARSRLAALLGWLAGPSAVSLAGLVRDAREALYRRAFALHRGLVPAELHVSPAPEPTLANLRLVRALPLHGLDVRDELRGHFDAVERALLAAVASAGASDASARRERDLLDSWEGVSRERLTRAVAVVLSDSQQMVDGQALEDVIHPYHLE